MTYRSQMDRVTPGVADLDPNASQRNATWDWGLGGWDSGERVNYFADQLPGNWVRNWDDKGKYQGDYEQKDDPFFNGLTALALAGITAGAINPAMFSGGAAAGGAGSAGMTAAEAWGAGAGLGGDTLTAMGLGEAAGGAGLAAGGAGLSALAPASVGSAGGVAGVTAGGLGAGGAAAGGLGAGGIGAAGAAGASLIPGIANGTLGQIGAAVAGGLLGGKDGNTESKKEPWGPAQPYILDNLKSSKQLQDFYQQNPFNQQQKTSYQNTFGDLDNFRQNTAPGLMDFANNAMTSTYQRQRGGNAGDGAGYGGPVRQGGLLQSGARPFSVAPGQAYGLLDFNAMNPFRK